MPRKYISIHLKKKIAKRAAHRCEYCKCPKAYSPGPFDMEHIIPVSLEGATNFQNLAYACSGCNSYKSNKIKVTDSLNGDLVSLFHPVKDEWSNHFLWSNDNLKVIGTTPTGRVTVDLLRLNRAELVNIRRLLMLVGEHPPKEN